MKLLLIISIISLITISCDENEISVNPDGIGPIKTLELKTINDSLMQRGKKLFESRCTECHTMEFKNSGPDISDILAYREPSWVMNFMLNKEEMLIKDSISITLRKQYDIDCEVNLHNENEAFELLEYFRIYQIWLHEFNGLYE